MKRKLTGFVLGLVLLVGLPTAGLGAAKVTNLAEKHWAYPYLLKAASYEVDGWWLEFADKDATRLNLAQILAKYLGYLEKKNLINREAAVKEAMVKDITPKSENYPAVVSVAYQYKIMPCYKGGFFAPEGGVPLGQFAIVLAKLTALNKTIDVDETELVQAVKNKIMDDIPADAFRQNRPVKRYEVIAALVKTEDFIRDWPRYAKENNLAPKKQAAPVVPETETTVVVKPKSQIRLGGSFGGLYERSALVNQGITYGGKIVYDNQLDASRAIELIGAGSLYDISYLVPSSGIMLKSQETRESLIDAQLNYKNALVNGFWGGKVASVFGLRGLFLKNDVAADSSLLGLRGGIEYTTALSDATAGRVGAGVTARLSGVNGASALGGLTSALDFGAEIAHHFSKDVIISLNYETDALIFNQQNVRYFNSLLVKSGWEM